MLLFTQMSIIIYRIQLKQIASYVRIIECKCILIEKKLNLILTRNVKVSLKKNAY